VGGAGCDMVRAGMKDHATFMLFLFMLALNKVILPNPIPQTPSPKPHPPPTTPQTSTPNPQVAPTTSPAASLTPHTSAIFPTSFLRLLLLSSQLLFHFPNFHGFWYGPSPKTAPETVTMGGGLSAVGACSRVSTPTLIRSAMIRHIQFTLPHHRTKSECAPRAGR